MFTILQWNVCWKLDYGSASSMHHQNSNTNFPQDEESNFHPRKWGTRKIRLGSSPSVVTHLPVLGDSVALRELIHMDEPFTSQIQDVNCRSLKDTSVLAATYCWMVVWLASLERCWYITALPIMSRSVLLIWGCESDGYKSIISFLSINKTDYRVT